MKPVKLLLILATFNIALIAVAFKTIVPSEASTLNLKEVSVQQPIATPQLVSGTPNRLTIKSINLDIEVKNGEYDPDTHEWTLEKDKAHFAVMTPVANNQAGNTFIYGHNNKQVFGNLDKIVPGEIAEVMTNNGKFIYQLSSIREVEPSDTSLFDYRGESILSIQTCSGSWYEKRKIFQFKFLNHEPIKVGQS